MDTSEKIYLKLIFKFILLLSLFVFTSNAVLAASQGKRGKSSSASVDISVYVSQTLSTESPNELLLDQSKILEPVNSKPFCIAHHGFDQNAGVPYELKVDKLSSTLPNNSFPYKIYLEDQSLRSSKLHLAAGMTLPKQSNISSNQNLRENCKNSGLSLSIEMDETRQNGASDQIPPGLMILMVGPI